LERRTIIVARILSTPAVLESPGSSSPGDSRTGKRASAAEAEALTLAHLADPTARASRVAASVPSASVARRRATSCEAGSRSRRDLLQVRSATDDELELEVGLPMSMNRWMTGMFSRCRSCAAAKRPPSRWVGVELPTLATSVRQVERHVVEHRCGGLYRDVIANSFSAAHSSPGPA
jgi:hypothetical protein